MYEQIFCAVLAVQPRVLAIRSAPLNGFVFQGGIQQVAIGRDDVKVGLVDAAPHNAGCSDGAVLENDRPTSKSGEVGSYFLS